MAPISPALRSAIAEAVSAVVSDVLPDAVREAVTEAVAHAINEAVPEAIRRGRLPIYLTKRQLSELTGWSERKIDYLRAQRRIPFVQRGRTVLFPTAEVEAYLGEGYVPARER